VRAQVHEPDAIREEHDQHHANAEYHGWDEEQKESQALEAQVHEVGHDQGRLDQREADQNCDHQVNFKAFVGEKNFDGGQEQQPDPNDREESSGAYGMLVREFGVSVRAHYEVLSLLLRIHAQQINHGKNEHPNEINEMPVQAAHFHMLGGVLPFSKTPGDDCQISDTDRDVKHVKAGEAEKRAAKQRHAPGISPRSDALAEQRYPFRGVDEHERDSEDNGCDQVADGFLAVASEGSIYAQDHGQAAGEQDECHE
jgi:hypothetical protein